MLEYVKQRMRRPAFWVWLAIVVAVGTAAACSDAQAPKITEETSDTLPDSLDNTG